MKTKLLIIAILSMIMLSACASEDACVTADSVKQVKSFEINHHPYFIYLRVSGAHDSAVNYELYDNVPVFDKCGKADLAVVATAHVDPAAGTIGKLLIDGLALKILYHDQGPKHVDMLKVPLEIKRR